jgi:hypothetical protein
VGRSDLLRRWVLASTLGEVVGLGGTGLLGWLLVGRDGGPVAAAAVLAGAQALALRRVVVTLAVTGAVVGVINGSCLTRMVVPRVEP